MGNETPYYGLLAENDEENQTQADKITIILKEAVKQLMEVDPDYGIGDTATDECIASAFYSFLHWTHLHG